MRNSRQNDLVELFETLACRFESIADEQDHEVAASKLTIQMAFAGEWLRRLEVFAYPKQSTYRNEVLSTGSMWLSFLGVMRQRFPTSPYCPAGGESLEVDRTAYEKPPWIVRGSIGLGDARITAMHQGNACRWLAWMVRTKHPGLKIRSRANGNSKTLVVSHAELEKCRKLYEDNPEPQKKDILALGVGSDKAQVLRDKMREEGLEQKARRSRRRSS